LSDAADAEQHDRAKTISLFVSSPGDVRPERDAATRVVQRINDEQRGLLNVRDIRWETAYYGAHATFQSQIIETEACDLVVCVFWRRLGSELPADFPQRMKNGTPYPSGTVYELVTALEAHSAKKTPDVWVYKKAQAVTDASQDADEMERRAKQWRALDDFWKEFFVNAQGQFTAAYQPFETVDQFEATFEKNLRDWLTDKGLLQARPSWPLAEKGSPFRGLEAFDFEHERIMFGRERLAVRAVEAVQRDLVNKSAYLLLIGESGAGKSSLARAAVLPRILRLTGEGAGRADVWRLARLSVSASESPFALLANALFTAEALPELAQSDYPTPATLASVMQQAGSAAVAPIMRALGRAADQFRAREKFDRPATARLALLIDQFESLFAAPADDQAKFAALIRELVATGLVAVVATLRTDRYEAYCRVGDLLALKEAGAMLDAPMPGLAEIADIVRNPAKAAGLSYGIDAEKGEALDETLIKATAGRDALPLLQFTLEKLYEAMAARLASAVIGLAAAKPDDLVLRPEDYAALGGLEGAIGLVADTVYRGLDPDAQAALPRLVRALVRGADKSAISEAGLEREIVKSEPMARLVRALLARRILVAGVRAVEGGKPETTIRFAHEAVIRGWPVVREQIAADENFYRIRDEVAAAERRWRDSGKPDDRLIAPGLPLAEAETLVHDFKEELPKDLFDYVEASSTREAVRRDKELADARRREEDARRLAEEQRKVADAQRQVAGRTRVGLVAAVLLAIVALVAAFVAIGEQRVALVASREAQTKRDEAEASKQEALVEKDAADRATLEAKTQRDAAEDAKKQAIAREIDAKRNQTAALTALSKIAIQTNPTRAAKLALAAWPRDAKDRTPQLAVTVTALGAAVPQLAERAILRGHDGYIASAAFSPDGTRVVTASEDKTARLWNAMNGGQITVLRGHEDVVLDAAFSPDGMRVVTASYDHTARLWDATTGAPIAILIGHEDRILSAAFSPDGSRVLTASQDSTVRVWDAATGAQIAVLEGNEGDLVSAAFSPDGRRIVTGSTDITSSQFGSRGQVARLWDAATGVQIYDLIGHEGGVRSVAFSPDGARIVTASNDKTARLWDATTGKCVAVLSGHEQEVVTAAFSPDGRRVVTASYDHTARVWNTATGAPIAVLRGHEDRVASAAFSPDGTRVVTASEDKTARLWEAPTGKEISVLTGHEDQIVSAAFSPDGTRVVTASLDKTARLWDAATDKEISVLTGHENQIVSAAFSPDGTRVVTASDDKTARVWNAATGAPIAVLKGHKDMVLSAAFSPDGTRVVTASDDKTARLWDAATGAPIAVLNHGGSVGDAEFSPDGTRVVTASDDKTARLWDATTGAQIVVFKGHEDRVVSAAFSPDGTRVVTASYDNTARLWDAKTGNDISVLRGHAEAVSSAVFSPDGKRIVTASFDNTARLWDPTTGASIAVLKGHENNVVSVAFSPDGTRVVTASDDKTARIWDPTTGASIAVLKGHENNVVSAVFSPDGRRIVTASLDSTARIWDASMGAPIAVLKGHEEGVESAAFSPDGTRVVTASLDKTARIWDVSSIPRGNIFQIACAWLPDHDLTDIARDYGLAHLEPICEGDPPLPDWLAK
jgi:WD40 repeat protein